MSLRVNVGWGFHPNNTVRHAELGSASIQLTNIKSRRSGIA